MQKITKTITGFLALAVLSGCSTVMNPYSSDFSCPQGDKGKCVSVSVAYEESLTGRSSNPFVEISSTKSKSQKYSKPSYDRDGGAGNAPVDNYQDAVYKRMTGLLRDPVTPIIAPPQVLRVLLLAYRGDDNELFMPRYSYVVIDSPQWVLDNEIIETGE